VTASSISGGGGNIADTTFMNNKHDKSGFIKVQTGEESFSDAVL
jgi:hypothetical protein